MTRLVKQPLPPEVLEAIRTAGGTIAYLAGETEAVPYTLLKEVNASTHGSVIQGELCRCLIGRKDLPVGTEGWLFYSYQQHYSQYFHVGGMNYPAPGADIIRTGVYYTFVTFVELESGHRVVADYFTSTEHEPRVVGKVGDK